MEGGAKQRIKITTKEKHVNRTVTMLTKKEKKNNNNNDKAEAEDEMYQFSFGSGRFLATFTALNLQLVFGQCQQECVAIQLLLLLRREC